MSNKDISELVRRDFDCIALLSTDEGWEHNNHYHGFLLKNIPEKCVCALDIGCGTGEFTRLLAKRTVRVIGIDLSPIMVQIARERSKDYPNMEYHVANVIEWDFQPQKYDYIVSIATFHHLPMESMLEKVKVSLKIGGILAILDLYKQRSVYDIFTNFIAVPANIALKLIKNGTLKQSKESKAAWSEHGKRDQYPQLSYIRQICDSILPGALIKRHLFWRYSIVWKKS